MKNQELRFNNQNSEYSILIGKNTLNEISPIAFSVHVKGHKKLYFYINNKNSSISFSEIFPSQFNINASMMDIIQTFSSGKLKKNLIETRIDRYEKNSKELNEFKDLSDSEFYKVNVIGSFINNKEM